MGGRPEDEAEAPTLAQVVTPGTPTAFSSRASRPEIEGLGPGAMIGRYCLARRIGAGAMGVVWSAHDPQLDRSIAIKLVHPSLARSEEAAGRLLREARAMAKLSHRSVITVHDAGNVDGQLFIAMELIDGTNLGTILRGRDAQEVLDWRRWLALMVDAGKGLEAAHAGGVLHRDFKPDNVLVDRTGRVAVGDFGLATLGEETFAGVLSQRVDKAAEREIDLTTTGSLLGTPAYMSPQQLRSEPIDARADQFSYCVATWEALYGARPFSVSRDGLDAVPELAATIDSGNLPDPPPGCFVPASVRTVLARGLAPDPAARWPDMGALLTALTASVPALPGRPTVERPIARRYRGYLILASVIAVLGVAGAFTLGRRAATTPEPQPAIAPPASPQQPIAKKLFSVPLRTSLAMSPDGKRLALFGDRIQVRNVDDAQLWSTTLPKADEEVAHVAFVGDELRFSHRYRSAVYRWSYLGDGATHVELEDLGGTWYGTTTLGELAHHFTHKRLVILDRGREVRRWTHDGTVETPVVSPDGRRFAYIESTRFSGRIHVRDVETEQLVTSSDLDSPTALGWLDERTLLYGTGTLEQPRIMRVSIEAGRFGTPVEIYGLETGWFGPFDVRGNRLHLIQMQPTPRARLIDRSGTANASRDLDHATISLGWIGDREFLSWSRNTQRVERRRDAAIELTETVLDGEPANATTAGDILIATVRRAHGREAIAVSRSTGATLWRHRDGRTLAVRCAVDLRPPCFAIRVAETEDQVVSLDPATGELGTTPLFRGHAEDLAVSADAARLLIVGHSALITELDPSTNVRSTSTVPLTAVRSIAYDPRGGVLVGGTQSRSTYMVGRMNAGAWQVILQTDGDILSFVRPSPDGDQILVLTRVYSPEVWQLQLPTAP